MFFSYFPINHYPNVFLYWSWELFYLYLIGQYGINRFKIIRGCANDVKNVFNHVFFIKFPKGIMQFCLSVPLFQWQNYSFSCCWSWQRTFLPSCADNWRSITPLRGHNSLTLLLHSLASLGSWQACQSLDISANKDSSMPLQINRGD